MNDYSLYLRGAERASKRVASDASNTAEDALSLTYYVGKLPHRLPFMTDAEAAMEQAEIALSVALIKVKSARKRYEELAKTQINPASTEYTELLSLEAAE